MDHVTTILCPNPACHKPNQRSANYCQYCGKDVVLNNDTPSDNRRYHITRIIKQGGQGAVYEGMDQDGRIYAIKEMLDYFTDPKERAEAISRFNAEADLLQKLTHPRIPRVYSHFTDEGRHYLTMDFVQGEDLEQIVERSGALPESQVLTWADQICDVLDYLHSKGLIYRDMKPSNVMIDAQDGNIKLIDFGIAKLLKPTERGTQIGTPGYAPPEQYQGLATTASDIYALGATLHHLLTGRDPTDHPPFSFPPARNVNVNVSRRTSDALEQALKMKPAERLGSVAEFRAMLRPLPATRSTQVRVAPRSTVVLPSAAQPQMAASPSAGRASRTAGAQARPGGQVARVPPQAPAAPQPANRPLAGTNSATGIPAASAQPARARRRGGCVGRVIGLVLVLVGIAALSYFLIPDLVRPYLSTLPSFEEIVPQAQPTPVQLQPPRFLTLELEVLVPAGADANTIRAEFSEAYREQLERDYPGASINQSAQISIVGSQPEEVAREGDSIRYRATVQGFVQLPQGP